MLHISNDYDAAVLGPGEGGFFTSYLGITANTAVAVITIALGQTSPHLVIFNAQPKENGKNLYMRYVKWTMTTAMTSLTSVQHVGVLNSGSVHTTVGTLMSTPVNVNGASGEASLTKLYAGVNIMSTPAAESRIVHTGEVDNSVPIVLDSWNLVYGEPGGPGFKGIGAMSVVKNIIVPVPPVIIPPQTYYTLGFWGVSWASSAGQFRTHVGWIEA